MTFAEFERLPETEATQELLDGELIERPPEKLSHMMLVKGFISIWHEYCPSRVCGWKRVTGSARDG